MKIVINNAYGGFSVSEAVYNELEIPWDGYGYIRNEDLNIESNNYDACRSDKHLIAAIEKLGLEKSNGGFSCLKIVEIPDNIEWEINNYHGIETIHEKHRSW